MTMQEVEVNKEKDVTCPHCQKDFTLNVKQKKPKMVIEENNTLTVAQSATGPITVPLSPAPEPPRPKTVIESHIPAYKCPDGNCGQIHKNKNYKQRPKGKCTNCQQFNKEDKGTCPWCDKPEVEPIEEDELDDLGIPRPEGHTHEEE